LSLKTPRLPIAEGKKNLCEIKRIKVSGYLADLQIENRLASCSDIFFVVNEPMQTE